MADKAVLKHCEFCGAPFVDDTPYNKIACDAQACRDAYAEWLHGDSSKTAVCVECGREFHPDYMPPNDKVCFRLACNWKRVDRREEGASAQLKLFADLS